MKKILMTFLLSILFCCNFNASKPFIVKKNTPVIAGASVAAVAFVSALLIYNFAGQDDLIELDSDQKNKEKDIESKSSKILKALGISLIPTALLGGSVWGALNSYTPNSYKKWIKNKTDKTKLSLLQKFSDGSQNLFDNIEVNEKLRFINDNFGKKNLCPLIEAESFLRENKSQLLKAIKYIEELRAQKYDDAQVAQLGKEIAEISDQISTTLELIVWHSHYMRQREDMNKFYQNKLDRQERGSDGRRQTLNNVIMCGSVLKGVSDLAKGIAGYK